MKTHDDEYSLRIRPRESETVPLKVPKDTLSSLNKVAAERDMSLQGLLRLYVGQGLRQDLSRRYADHVLETAAQVLARHFRSEEEISAILREIQAHATA